MKGTGTADPLSREHRQAEDLIIQRMVQAYEEGRLGPTCDQITGLSDHLRVQLETRSIDELRQEIESLGLFVMRDWRLALLQVVADPTTTRADLLGLVRHRKQRVLKYIPACDFGNSDGLRYFRMS